MLLEYYILVILLLALRYIKRVIIRGQLYSIAIAVSFRRICPSTGAAGWLSVEASHTPAPHCRGCCLSSSQLLPMESTAEG